MTLKTKMATCTCGNTDLEKIGVRMLLTGEDGKTLSLFALVCRGDGCGERRREPGADAGTGLGKCVAAAVRRVDALSVSSGAAGASRHLPMSRLNNGQDNLRLDRMVAGLPCLALALSRSKRASRGVPDRTDGGSPQ